MKRILRIEGAGMPSAEVSRKTIGNCRCRTAFHLDDGRAVYLEFRGWNYDRHSVFHAPWKYTGSVDFFFLIGPDNLDYEPIKKVGDFEYSHDGVMKLLRSIGATFDDFEVVNDGTYRVHGTKHGTYNFGEMEEEEIGNEEDH